MPRKRESEPVNAAQGALGKAIEEVRAEKEVSLAALAEAAGVSERRMGDYERGQGNPGYRTLLKIFIALGVTPGEIMTRADKIQLQQGE